MINRVPRQFYVQFHFALRRIQIHCHTARGKEDQWTEISEWCVHFKIKGAQNETDKYRVRRQLCLCWEI